MLCRLVYKLSVQDFGGRSRADRAVRAREQEVGAEPGDRTESLPSCENTGTGEASLFMDEQRKWLLEVEPTPGEDAVETGAKTTEDLEHYRR